MSGSYKTRLSGVAAVAAIIAASCLASACGGGGSSSTMTVSNSLSVLKLSSGVQSEHVAQYAGGFAVVSGPSIAAIYTAALQPLLRGAGSGSSSSDGASSLGGTSSTGGTATACPAGGTLAIRVQNPGVSNLADGFSGALQTGERVTLGFDQCAGKLKAPGIADDAPITGSVSVQVQSATGQVGSTTGDWSYSAIETAQALTLTSPGGTTVIDGTVSYTTTYDASTGVTTTTASAATANTATDTATGTATNTATDTATTGGAPTITLHRTQTAASGVLSGDISIASFEYTRVRGGTPLTDTLTASGSVSVSTADAVLDFSMTTPTPVTISKGDLQGGVLQLTTGDTVETVTLSDESTFDISVTANGQTGSYTEDSGDFRLLIGG